MTSTTIKQYLVANSTPIVLLLSMLNSLRVNLDRRFVLPTPESPTNTTEKDKKVSSIGSGMKVDKKFQNFFIIFSNFDG
jgi:hypothetical protein